MENSSPIDINIRNVDIVRLNDALLESNMNGELDNSLYISSASKSATQKESYNDQCKDHSQEIPSECFDGSKGHSNCILLNGCHKTMHEEMKRIDLGKNGLIKCNKVELLNSHLEKLNLRTCDHSLGHEELIRTKIINKEIANPKQILAEFSSLKISETEEKSNVTLNAQEAKFKTLSVCEHSEIFIETNLIFLAYESEKQMPDIMRLIQKDLSEPYSIYTYRYFIHNWPKLCFLARYEDRCVGAIVCKLDVHKKQSRRGYIAMLAVDENYRKRKIGSNLVKKAIRAMIEDNADEVVLETEITNKPALKLYENLGFVRDKRLFRYYLNGVDALRLKLWLR